MLMKINVLLHNAFAGRFCNDHLPFSWIGENHAVVNLLYNCDVLHTKEVTDMTCGQGLSVQNISKINVAANNFCVKPFCHSKSSTWRKQLFHEICNCCAQERSAMHLFMQHIVHHGNIGKPGSNICKISRWISCVYSVSMRMVNWGG